MKIFVAFAVAAATIGLVLALGTSGPGVQSGGARSTVLANGYDTPPAPSR